MRNPRILTLDAALALAETPSSTEDLALRQAEAGAVRAVCDRVRCRFTGPSNFWGLNYGERLVYEVLFMQGEVLNGGFHQYLTNSTADRGEELKRYLSDIGAAETLSLVQQVSTVFPEGIIPESRDLRCDLLMAWEDSTPDNSLFDDLNGIFYNSKESLDRLMLNYIRRNRAEFEEPSEEIVKKFERQDRISEHLCGTT